MARFQLRNGLNFPKLMAKLDQVLKLRLGWNPGNVDASPFLDLLPPGGYSLEGGGSRFHLCRLSVYQSKSVLERFEGSFFPEEDYGSAPIVGTPEFGMGGIWLLVHLDCLDNAELLFEKGLDSA